MGCGNFKVGLINMTWGKNEYRDFKGGGRKMIIYPPSSVVMFIYLWMGEGGGDHSNHIISCPTSCVCVCGGGGVKANN